MTSNRWRYTDEYKKWRKKIFQRDKHCKFPNCRSRRRLQAHHIIRYADAANLIYEERNGILLCRKHHDFIHGKEHHYMDLFLEIVNDYYSR